MQDEEYTHAISTQLSHEQNPHKHIGTFIHTHIINKILLLRKQLFILLVWKFNNTLKMYNTILKKIFLISYNI